MKKYLLGLGLIPVLFQSQYMDNLTYGIKVGGLHSTITNLPEMMVVYQS
ncbi:hypothetical protein [Riemerella anatipestifer]|nr:hypothetical protein [Riemerella anatipestifer]MDR7750725.1 hypothetical protein [Riemerella anatipestifer]MDR7752792.1 hypothetical protein [Riemerella anatipestifer]MDR7754795.1 hypothetical protein [Riemerella anatipestifer]MDR7758917.1 hypothetical protein [Riemerella anatipestifer]MDR7765108.1 hypothetical protein [Riemerella anatipestifer]